MEALLAQAKELREAVIDFVLDAEGDLAVALESYSAAKLAQISKSPQQTGSLRELVMTLFLLEGQVGEQTPLQVFMQEQASLSANDRTLIQNWSRTFMGLFEVMQVLPDGFELMSWTTAKHYQVKEQDPREQERLARLKAGDILLAPIAPVTDDAWMFFHPPALLGKLGKPKLAVAIGSFKDNYKNYLYSDAPELLAEAWKSVARYHEEFVEFFGSEELTLPGYQLDKKLAEFQKVITERRFEAAGIDPSKSLEELATEAGLSDDEIAEAAEAMGADPKTLTDLKAGKQPEMVAPKIALPDALKKADQVTMLSHPHWGQLFLSRYPVLKALLVAEDWQSGPNAAKVVRQALEDLEMNAFVWHRLAEQFPQSLENVLQTVLDRPTFNLQTDLDEVLQEFGKPIKPELPETASVPIHLNDLFQDALLEVHKSKKDSQPKEKSKRKAAAGFRQR
ncbi:hypothetical protein ACN4EK_22525 [Pantanalinema rosaneae CENA516]|uniref:hypothetical protein n=1 Tax=Pantanalinema rosaneae TaxID=1620701 RepID=UPI003D6E4FD2